MSVSGIAIMSDSSMALKPVIEEPSNPIPPSRASPSSSLVMAKLLSWPRMSVNQSRMNLTSRSSTAATTSSLVIPHLRIWVRVPPRLPERGRARHPRGEGLAGPSPPRAGRPCYLMKRISEYFGSGQRSSATVRSSPSAIRSTSSIAGSTVSRM